MRRPNAVLRVLGVSVLLVWGAGSRTLGAEDGAEAPVRVWATGDGVRVCPVTGRYLEDRPDIHADYPTGDYRKHNLVWDAAKNRVGLRAARNEFVAFQVVVEAREPLRGVTVRFEKLTGPEGRTISGRNVALFKAWYMHVTQKSTGFEKTSLGPGWFADAVIPAGIGKPAAFDIPDRTNAVKPTQKNQTVWVDVYVPRDRTNAPPGTYRGTLQVTWPGGRREIAVELDVWDFALPDETHCRGDIWNGSLRRMTLEMELKYYHMTRRHRVLPGVAGYKPKLRVKGTKVTIDWSEYDARLTKYFDGSAFTRKHGFWGAGRGVPLDHILLPFNVGWPMGMPKDGDAKRYEAVWLETCRQIKAHFDATEHGRKLGKVIFIGGLDESYSIKAYKKLIAYSELLNKGFGKGWFQYRIDGGYNSPAMRMLSPHVDLWVCHTAGYDFEKVERFRKSSGVEPWFYGPMVYERQANASCGSNTLTDMDLNTSRGIGWLTWKLRSGYCQWEFDAFMDEHSKIWRPEKAGEKMWTQAINARWGRGKAYNGSGLLILRGMKKFSGSTDPVPTIRLKATRRGLQDYEYFWLLKQAGKGDEADKLVNEIAHTIPFGRHNYRNPNIWKHNPEAWEANRIKAGELLHAAAKP